LCDILLHLVLSVNGATSKNNQPGDGIIQWCLLPVFTLAQARHIISQQS